MPNFYYLQKMPIELPKADENAAIEVVPVTPNTPPPTPASANSVFAQPDVIPTAGLHEKRFADAADVVVAPPPVEFTNYSDAEPHVNDTPEEELYANVQKTVSPDTVNHSAADDNVTSKVAVEEENIYQNTPDLADCIDDTGIRAVALYDYEAAADDEISFDPDDLITHIEQVCI